MKLPERFERAYQALLTAFFDETLAKCNCTACAVGNIVAAGYNTKVFKDKDTGDLKCNVVNREWSSLFVTLSNSKKQGQYFEKFYNKNYEDLLAIDNVNVTGYSVEELARVEFAFETNTIISYQNYFKYTRNEIMEDQYNGLMAVVDVLCEIEGLNSTEYKKAFEYTIQ